MMKPRELLCFLVLGTVVCLVLGYKPPIVRFSYELVNLRGYGKPGRCYQ